MTDLGFGLADKRTIILVLVVFTVSYAFFGFSIPIDTSSATSIFLSLVSLTGFLFLSRNLTRIALTLLGTIVSIPFRIRAEFKSLKRLHPTRPPGLHDDPIDALRESWTAETSVELVSNVLMQLRYDLWLPLVFRDWYWNTGGSKEWPRFLVLGALDRVCLIAIAFLPTVPVLRPYVSIVGICGMILMLAVYVLTGRFTFLVWDATHKAEAEQPTTDIVSPRPPKLTDPPEPPNPHGFHAP